MDDRTSEFLQDVIRRNGVSTQLFQCAEELAEMTQAVSKYNRCPSFETRTNLIEEMADVLIMLRQVRIIAAINPEEVSQIVDFKLKRLEERLNAGE